MNAVTDWNESMRRLIQEARAALAGIRRRQPVVDAWDALQRRDANGNALGPEPYTGEAMNLLAAAYREDPDDEGILHHLAIAHHARAWDLELLGDPRAEAEWELALRCWGALAASPAFWKSLKNKLLSCDPNADPASLDETRRDLLENLLDIHVDFIRHYCELDDVAKATQHVGIIQRASLPPAVRKRLTDKVFEAMVASVPEARAHQAYLSALTTVERFLSLFPDSLPALRLHVELCREWVNCLSYRDDWPKILELVQRAEPWARASSQHAELSVQPLAKTALMELAEEILLRAGDRGSSFLMGREVGAIGVGDRDAAKAAFFVAVQWGRLALPHSPTAPWVLRLFCPCLQNLAFCLQLEVKELLESGEDLEILLETATARQRIGVSLLEEALVCSPADAELAECVCAARERLEALEHNLATLRLG